MIVKSLTQVLKRFVQESE